MYTQLKHILFNRHLLLEFLRRDLQARYVGSVMGFFWSVINPLVLLCVYTVVFGTIFQVDIPTTRTGEPRTMDFAFYIFCGLLPWYAFQEALVRSTTCIVDNSHLIKQVRFPAKIIPAYLTLSSLVNQLIGTLILLLFFLVFQVPLPVTILAVPLILAIQAVFMFGINLLFATLNTYLRDIAPLVSTATMILMWAAPMFYHISIIHNTIIRKIIFANPITYLLMINHRLILEGVWPELYLWVTFGSIALGFFIVGYWIFTRCHREFADLI